MDNKSGGQILSSQAKQQQTAAELARQKLIETYRAQPQNYRAPSVDSPAPQVQAADWKKYHSAWQDYYKKYYGEYYGKAARDYVMREKMKIEREHADKMKAMQDSHQEQLSAALAQNAQTEEESKQIQDEFAKRCGALRCKDLKTITDGKPLCPCEECVRNAVMIYGEMMGLE